MKSFFKNRKILIIFIIVTSMFLIISISIVLKHKPFIESSEREINYDDDNDVERPPLITYSCPDGYTLIGFTCTIIVSAKYDCRPGYIIYNNNENPDDPYCINTSKAFDTTNDECPSGSGIVKIIVANGTDVYQCFPLHEKEYLCPDGYTLDGLQCTSVIDANIS